MKNKILTVLILLLANCAYISAQSIITEFGKNRVQHHDDLYNWSRYETENFMTYWYGKSRNIAQTVIQMAELDHNEIQKVLEHTLSDKIEIIVYTDLSDLKQSNIGLEDAFTSQNDQVVVQGDKMMVYFDGNHKNLRKQIRQGVAHIYLNSILFGSNIQEIVQNALLLNLPAWFTEGIIAFAGDQWNHEIDDELRDLLSNPRYANFEKLALDHPRVAGHSLWNYIDHSFGSATIANIIYLTRISRSLDNSFLFILGVDYEVIKDNWYTYYRNHYEGEHGLLTKTEDLNKVKLKNKKGVPISQFSISPDGQYLAYITNDRGRSRIVSRDLLTGTEQTILKTGTKNIFQETDFNYPKIAWHPRYPELTILYEYRDIVKLRKIDIKNDTYEEQDFTTNFQRVYSIEYIAPDEYLVSASTDGFSDLYVYKAENRHHTRITEDFYDDLEARVIQYKGTSAILFKSNRETESLEKNKLDTILPLDNFDLFLLKGFDKNAELERLTHTKNVNESQAYQSSPNHIIYLSENSGINNAYQLDLETGQSQPITNLERNIIKHHVSPASNEYFFNYYYKGNYDTFVEDKEQIGVKTYTTKQGQEMLKDGDVIVPFLPDEHEDEIVLTEGMKFQAEFEDPADLIPLDDTDIKQPSNSLFDKYFKDYLSNSYQDGRRIVKFNPMRASATRERFRLANFTSKMDNEVLFEGLESYTGDDKALGTTPVGLLLKAEIKDLFEDHEITIGLRVPTTFNGYEYFVTLDNNKHLWDRRITFYRKSTNVVEDPEIFPAVRLKRHTFLGLYRLKYPFDVYQSLRFTGALRLDKLLQQSTDLNTFNAPEDFEKRLSLKAEYVFDNSYDVSINIKNGTRAKVFLEGINQFDFNIGNNNTSIDPSTAITGVLGFDARHYIPVFKRAVLALRATGATSIGNQRIIYYLGGVEGWIFSSAEENVPTPPTDDFSFKVLAPQLRGFKNNIRNGNNYLLSNIEFRFPLAQFIGLGKSNLAFFRNLQIAGFFDGGLAWYGASPTGEQNPLNNVFVSNPPDNPIITVEARYFRDPIVYGYGTGIRTTMLGYFIKVDYGWGVETGNQRGGQLYLSLGMDF